MTSTGQCEYVFTESYIRDGVKRERHIQCADNGWVECCGYCMNCWLLLTDEQREIALKARGSIPPAQVIQNHEHITRTTEEHVHQHEHHYQRPTWRMLVLVGAAGGTLGVAIIHFVFALINALRH